LRPKALWQKLDAILDQAGLAALRGIDIAYRDAEPASPEGRSRLARPSAMSTPSPAGRSWRHLRADLAGCRPLPVGAGGRPLAAAAPRRARLPAHKSYLKLRPGHHHGHRQVRARILPGFLPFYLAKQMELKRRTRGEGGR